MATISELKELEAPGTPLFLFDCTLRSGDVQRWSTHGVSFNGNPYLPRVLRHNLFDLTSSPESATDGVSRVSLTLANADSLLSSIERNVGWKGARLTVTFVFFDLRAGIPESETRVVFRGVANPPEESTESDLRLSFTNRLNLQRVFLPDVRIQKRCPWIFPATEAQRQEAVTGGSKGKFSQFYRCGYSPDQPNGAGNLNGNVLFTTCDYSRAQCEQRGMFDSDGDANLTRRFGGIEFVPASITVRSYGEKGSHVSTPIENQALYNDFVPIVYGTGWYQPPIVFARNDGNLTRCEVLLGAGEITSVVKVVVNSSEIPMGTPGSNMTATGWYDVVSAGGRNGNFNLDFSDATGKALGDPYGSMGILSVVVPNRISGGSSMPSIRVLIRGLKLQRFDAQGNPIGDAFTNNPAWVLLDILRRSGWGAGEIDLPSFANVAERCDALVHTVDLNGNDTLIPRCQCNLILTKRRSVGDIIRGIRNGSALYLTISDAGLLQLKAEDALAVQQPSKLTGTNSTAPLNGGWPAYEFGDNSFSGILRRENGSASLRLSSRPIADTPNRYTVEFQDEFNEYQQDSLSLVDIDDSLLGGQDITTALTALGLPNCDQATRAAALQLCKSVRGNTYVEFNTSVKGMGLRPGDLITLTYSKEGFERQPFRITSVSPGLNYLTATISAQIHDDSWYASANLSAGGSGRPGAFDVGLPRPLVGSMIDADGVPQFGITELSEASSDGSITTTLSVKFSVPQKTIASKAGIPLVGLNPQVGSEGGTIAGGQTVYYGFSALDAVGAESALSFTVMVQIPASTDTNEVTFANLSFSAAAKTFHVYRGTNPVQLLRIAENMLVGAQFTDSGSTAMLQGPPDYNYDHANFYWRLELQPDAGVDIHSPTSVGGSALHMLVNEYRGATVRITKGRGTGQERVVISNTATTILVSMKWDIEPDNTSRFLVADSSWHYGASGAASPLSFVVPNREGATIHISGRAANVLDQETDFLLSPLTPWRILGEAGGSLDGDVPGTPIFGLSPTGQGTLEVLGIGFSSFLNTRTISAGTLTLASWNELNGPSSITLSIVCEEGDTTLSLSTSVSLSQGDLIQIESEIMTVLEPVISGTTVSVTRGSHQSNPAVHAAGVRVYLLDRKTFILPFARDFFGSPASGSYAFPLIIPDIRIAAAELFMTNMRGNSEVARQSFTLTSDYGLRTLSGGQLSIQVEGPLSIQTDAVPFLLVESPHSVRDVYAVVQEAPGGQPVNMRLTQNGQTYCELSIPAGQAISNVVDGFALPPLQAMARLGLDITSVVQSPNVSPGHDLTVTIRL